MAKERFFHAETPKIFKKLEELSRRSGVSRAQAFEDWLTAMVCALAAETKEAEYLGVVERHKEGKQGQRGIDLIGQMFAELVLAMGKSDNDILGDLFEGGITYGENGQYLTPENIAHFMTRLSLVQDAKPSGDTRLYVSDPCCGSGRMLLEAAKVNPHVELVGQDVDARCVKITAINLGLRARYGWVVCGNSLTDQETFAYRIGSFFNETPNGLRRGVIRDAPLGEMAVALLAENVRREAGEAIGQADADGSALFTFPSIIEVPRWLARLEPKLAALAHSDAAPPATTPEPQDSSAGDQVQRQQTLF